MSISDVRAIIKKFGNEGAPEQSDAGFRSAVPELYASLLADPSQFIRLADFFGCGTGQAPSPDNEEWCHDILEEMPADLLRYFVSKIDADQFYSLPDEFLCYILADTIAVSLLARNVRKTSLVTNLSITKKIVHATKSFKLISSELLLTKDFWKEILLNREDVSFINNITKADFAVPPSKPVMAMAITYAAKSKIEGGSWLSKAKRCKMLEPENKKVGLFSLLNDAGDIVECCSLAIKNADSSGVSDDLSEKLYRMLIEYRKNKITINGSKKELIKNIASAQRTPLNVFGVISELQLMLGKDDSLPTNEIQMHYLSYIEQALPEQSAERRRKIEKQLTNAKKEELTAQHKHLAESS